jgi:hypothetical protein
MMRLRRREAFARRNGISYGTNCWTGTISDCNQDANQPADCNNIPANKNGLNAFAHFKYNGDTGSAGNSRGGNLFENVCPDGTQTVWELGVVNGVYEVTTLHNGFANNYDITNFVIEGQRIQHIYRRSWSTIGVDAPLETIVDVTDGRLTVAYDGNEAYNGILNWLWAQKIGEPGSRTPAWLPGSEASGAWWQMEFDEAEPVG